MMAKNKHLSPAGTVTRAEVSQSMKAHAGWSAQWGQVLLPITGTGLGTAGQEGAPTGPPPPREQLPGKRQPHPHRPLTPGVACWLVVPGRASCRTVS